MGAMAILDSVGLLRSDAVFLRTQRETDAALDSVVVSISSTPLAITKTRADFVIRRRFVHDMDMVPVRSLSNGCVSSLAQALTGAL